MTDREASDVSDRIAVREATPADLAAVLNVLDGAALETDVDAVRERIDRDDVLVAVSDAGETADAGTVLGALVLVEQEIETIAVRRRRRGQGIGSALVMAAADRRTQLVAEFDSNVRAFYEALGFTIETTDEQDRYRGELDAAVRRGR